MSWVPPHHAWLVLLAVAAQALGFLVLAISSRRGTTSRSATAFAPAALVTIVAMVALATGALAALAWAWLRRDPALALGELLLLPLAWRLTRR